MEDDLPQTFFAMEQLKKALGWCDKVYGIKFPGNSYYMLRSLFISTRKATDREFVLLKAEIVRGLIYSLVGDVLQKQGVPAKLGKGFVKSVESDLCCADTETAVNHELLTMLHDIIGEYNWRKGIQYYFKHALNGGVEMVF